MNGRIVPLDYALANGDIVEIITSKSFFGPSRDWLNLLRLHQPKVELNKWFKKEKRAENIIKGHDLLEKELKKNTLI